ncbi:tyrosine--tRNA ligase [Candidatus Kaiserbacteria bacterium]|nr:tyrosine--tRNA ligase [Candidatus Kaiserbacteria bacterium]MCB9817967.1 tyrosine--tRNA ligase [Candidatus Nomurabacteria bacterium]
MSLTKELNERGFIHQFSASNLEDIIDGEKRTIYHGIDPTADSAHVGNMVVWMLLKHLADAGHKIIFLVGGGTGMIGDPKPDTERQLQDTSLVLENVESIKKQAENFFTGNQIEFVNNFDWLGSLKLIDFLRDVGKHYTVNELIKKDAIATRLQSDNGLSYTEFAYPLLQGYDYLQLFESKNCTVQVGGSDQWGNIISGVELVRRKTQNEVFAITVPLVVDKGTGKKFGKSEGNAVWLSSEKTSPYKFYQFWLNTSDESVVDYLKLFTTLSLDEIENIRQKFELNPGSRLAQKQLAFSVTSLVHDLTSAEAAQNVSEILFGGKDFNSLSEAEKNMLLETAPSSTLNEPRALVEVLVETGLSASKREAKMFVESGAVEINGRKIESVETEMSGADAVSGLILLKRGKKQLHIIKV